ncbi:MAG: hypothetical protein C0606_11360 [Hyphomicrobiales bacterium]|nr:MAG: hypothetical protein C0606_11360 [Hyphomicrobiales bacterium]
MPRNIDLFNEVVGLIFAQLYESFPVVTEIDRRMIGEGLGLKLLHDTPGPLGTKSIKFADPIDGMKFDDFLRSAASWLVSEGFVRSLHGDCLSHIVLTSKALAALNMMPEVVEAKTPGTSLTELANDVATDTRRAAITKIVGEVIGYAVKAVSS